MSTTKELLSNSTDRLALRARVMALTPDSQRQWGRMTVNQMLCTLNDSYLAMMDGRSVGSRVSFFNRTVVRWVAIHSGMTWPKGVKTMPAVDQLQGGTPPVGFEADRATLLASMERFASQTERDVHPHPIFGPLTTWEWQRWGWLHADHHLRQFGV